MLDEYKESCCSECKQLQHLIKQNNDLLKVIDELTQSKDDFKFRLHTVKAELISLYDKLAWLIPQGGRYKHDFENQNKVL